MDVIKNEDKSFKPYQDIRCRSNLVDKIAGKASNVLEAAK